MSQYRVLPYDGANPRQISEVVNGAMSGKLNNTTTLTMTASSATQTNLDDSRIGVESVLSFTPTTTAASTFMNNFHVSAKAVGSAVITHGVNTDSNRIYDVLIFG